MRCIEMTFNDMLIDLVMNRWGTTKTMMVFGFAIIGASVGGIFVATFVKDNPQPVQYVSEIPTLNNPEIVKET